MLAIIAVLWGVPHIEQVLGEKADAALTDPSVDVVMSGREATLIASGSAEAAEAARAQVAAIRGIRRATVDVVPTAVDEITVTPDTSPPVVETILADPSIMVRAGRGTFTLTGSVADEETVQALIAAAAAGYGEGRVTADIGVDPDTHTPAWLNDPFPVFAAVGSLELGIEVYDKVIRVTGTVPDEAARGQVIDALEAHLDGALDVHDRLVIVAVEEPIFAVETFEGSVTLRGALPSQGEVDAVRDAAEKIYGPESVATWLTVDPAVPALLYLSDPEAFFRAFEGRTLDFADTGSLLIVRGRVPTEAIRTAIGEALTAAVDPQGLTNELEVVPTDLQTQAAIDEINGIIGASLNFAPGSTALGDEDTAKLDQVAEIFAEHPSLRAIVEGHTDDGGGSLGNLRLSEERAQSVVDYLVGQGVDPDRLSTIGFGEERPIASNNTTSGRAQNRRIEFQVEG